MDQILQNSTHVAKTLKPQKSQQQKFFTEMSEKHPAGSLSR
jgi:hypothetical protein